MLSIEGWLVDHFPSATSEVWSGIQSGIFGYKVGAQCGVNILIS